MTPNHEQRLTLVTDSEAAFAKCPWCRSIPQRTVDAITVGEQVTRIHRVGCRNPACPVQPRTTGHFEGEAARLAGEAWNSWQVESSSRL